MKSSLLEHYLQADKNNFTLLRLLLALTVIEGHAYAFMARPGDLEPVHSLLHFDYSRGVAVSVFFFLSGVFVTGEYEGKSECGRLHREARLSHFSWPACLLTRVPPHSLSGLHSRRYRCETILHFRKP